MDFAYDHIQGEITAGQRAKSGDDDTTQSGQGRTSLNLNAEFQETLQAFSNSPWGARIGGLWNNVRKHGESYYEGARQEYNAVTEEASKGLNDLRNTIVRRTRGLSLGGAFSGFGSSWTDGESKNEATSGDGNDEKSKNATRADGAGEESGEGFIARFRAEAAKRLKDIERAEEAADEALLRFGTNIRNFLRDAVSILPPESGADQKDQVLFESKDAEGKRVIHATRFDAQLHVVHTNLDSFRKDPDSDQWPSFQEKFDVDSKTEDIARDLDKYPELRRAMEKLVPDTVEYAQFWARYYFLRLAIETEEKKRKELLKGANTTADEEEVAWDEDSDSEAESPSTPQAKSAATMDTKQNITTSSSQNLSVSDATLKEPRRSNDQQSQPDSESSYDVVSGATTQTPASPREKPADNKADDSDDDDWE
ncbi:hypothetical protein VTN31DRAFT_220 [Thermomyces dupontii]|uniref:uncharacterized protein n=1 Tax=Talaromyces thermophilus TaxID=28565 RepID=UPI00374391E4